VHYVVAVQVTQCIDQLQGQSKLGIDCQSLLLEQSVKARFHEWHNEPGQTIRHEVALENW
jgi:hypothetical protein